MSLRCAASPKPLRPCSLVLTLKYPIALFIVRPSCRCPDDRPIDSEILKVSWRPVRTVRVGPTVMQQLLFLRRHAPTTRLPFLWPLACRCCASGQDDRTPIPIALASAHLTGARLWSASCHSAKSTVE